MTTNQPPAARADGPAPLNRYVLCDEIRQGGHYGEEQWTERIMRSCEGGPWVAYADVAAALAEVATLKQENLKLKAEIQTETCPSCGEVCPAGWCGVCHVPIMTDWEKGFQRICEVAAQNLARAEQAEAEVATLKPENEKLKTQHENRSPDGDGQREVSTPIGESVDGTAISFRPLQAGVHARQNESSVSSPLSPPAYRRNDLAGSEPADSLSLIREAADCVAYSGLPRKDVSKSHAHAIDLVDRLRRALIEQSTLRAEVATLHQAHHWQPIETAPKDDTPILTYRRAGLVAVAAYFPHANAEWCCTDGVHLLDVTHWMPLPAAPDPAGLARRAARPQPAP